MGRTNSAVYIMVQRLTYRRRHCYATKSNGVRKVKTPGGKLTLHTVAKKAQAPKCGDCHKALQGIPVMRPYLYRRIAKNKKNVSRAYGGNRCAGCVRQRIVRALDRGAEDCEASPEEAEEGKVNSSSHNHLDIA